MKSSDIRALSGALRVGLSVARNSANIHRATDLMRAGHGEYNQMRRLAVMIRDGKLNRSLLEFADPKGTLSNFAQNIPSVESLDVLPVGRRDHRSVMAFEGLVEVIAGEQGALQEWLEKSADNTDSLISTIDYHLDGLRDLLSAAARRLSSGEDVALAAVTSDISFEARSRAITILTEVLTELEPIDVESLNDPEYRDGAKTAMAQIAEKLSGITGISVDEDAQVESPSDAEIDDDQIEQTASVESLGYTGQTLDQVIGLALRLVEALRSIADRRGEFVAGLLEAGDAVPSTEEVDIEDNIDTDVSEDQTKVIDEQVDGTGRAEGDTPEEGKSAADEPAEPEKPIVDRREPESASESLDCPVEDFQCLVSNYVQIFTAAMNSGVAQALAVVDLAQAALGDEDVEEAPAPAEASEG